jgi:hypothetical protein
MILKEMQMKIIERKTKSTNNFEITSKKVLDEITSDDDREELIYTVIDACPYDFELIPTIASFKYLSFYDHITQYNEIRYFSKMYELIDTLCHYKNLIEKMQTIQKKKAENTSIHSDSKSLEIRTILDENNLFTSCQISAIQIYKTFLFGVSNLKINDNVLAHSLNHIINEFFEESFTSKLKQEDILRPVQKKVRFMGVDVLEFCKRS